MLPSQLFLLPAFKCILEGDIFPLSIATYLFQSRNDVPLCLLLGNRVDFLFLLQKLSWVCNHDAIVPLCTGRDLCFFVFWTAASSSSRVAAWNPRDNPARCQIAWNCFSPTLPMNQWRNKGKHPTFMFALGEGSTCGMLITACLSDCFIPTCPHVHLAVCEGWRKRLKRFQFN